MAMEKLGYQIQELLDTNSETFVIRVVYTDGKVYEVSLQNLFSKPKNLAAEVLRGNLFERCFIEGGALAWANGLELCPDAMRIWGEEVKSLKKPAQ